MRRLANATLNALPANVARPAYDRTGVTPGIVHLGVGAFHRAHQAAMTEAAIAAGANDWGIVAASLRSPETRDALAPQDGLYTVAVSDADGRRHQVIGAIQRVLVAPENPEALLAAMADPRVRVVTLTVTEKGYLHDPATGALNEAHPDVIHDAGAIDRPRSAPGFLVAALKRRRQAGAPPFAVVSCDNLPANGRTTRRVVSRLAALVDPDLGRFVEGAVLFPSSMVDRIVPATTDADRAAVSGALGLEDRWPVMAEPFSQWVIEDDFPAGRPDWAIVGAEFVADVAGHERMKLRMLNGAHSTMAYLGVMAGHEFVADAAGDPAFSWLVTALWGEIAPTLRSGPGLDPVDYQRRLTLRFRNPAIRHRLAQIAMDGSQKLPQRLVAPLAERRAAGAPFGAIAFSLAAFLRFMTGEDGRGRVTPIRDPLAERFAARAREADPAAAMLAIGEVFGEIGRDPEVVDAVRRGFSRITELGAVGALAELMTQRTPDA